MARILRTDPFPTTDDLPIDAAIVTLHGGVAAALGVPHLSLRNLALDTVRAKGLIQAPRLQARHLLKQAITSVMVGVDPAAEATRIARGLDVVLRTGIDVDKLIEFGSPRVQNLGRIAAAYRDSLRSRSLIDPSEVFITAASLQPEPRRLCIFGHFRARSEEARFIHAISAEGSEYFLPIGDDSIFGVNRQWVDWFVAQGWEISRSNEQPQATGQALAAKCVGQANGVEHPLAFKYRSVSEECRAILSEIKQLLVNGVAAHNIAVVCRDRESYSAVLGEIADEYQIPLRFRNETPIGQTAFGGFVRVLLEAIASDLSFEAAARFFKHRFGPTLDGPAWKAARNRRTSGHKGWKDLGVETAILQWPDKQSFDAWINSIKSVIDEYGVRVALRSDAKELLAFGLFFESLVAASQLEGGGELSLDAFRGSVFEILAEEKVPFRPEHGGVGVFDPDAMIGSSYETIFVAGLSEGTYPSDVNDDTVVDFLERRELATKGIEFADAAEVARWEALSFYFTLSAARKHVHLSYAANIDNRERLPSSFFDRLGMTPESPQTEIAASAKENRRLSLRHAASVDGDAAFNPARHQQQVELMRESSDPYDEYDGVTGLAIDPAKHTWSASQLTMIGQCGFKWWAAKALRLKEVNEIETGMDYTKRGTFYHKVLELAVRRAQGAEDLRSAILENIDAAFADAEKDEETPLPMLANWDLQRDEHIRAIKKAVKAKDFIRYGSTVEDVEKEFELIWNDFKLRGAIDRIDNTPDGLIAIDYKTSGSPPKGAKDESGRLKVDVQIPLYAKVALPHLYPKGKFGESIYFSLTKGIVLAPKRSSELEPVEQLAARIRGELGKGSFAVDPDTNLDACEYCEFDSVCRKGPRLERKNTV